MALAQRRQARNWPFSVTPLHDALGCEITGITLAQAVEPKLFGKIYEAFLDYELILFRDVDLPPATQVAFARSFGEVQIHVMNQYQKYPEHPETGRKAIFLGDHAQEIEGMDYDEGRALIEEVNA